ncbi:MAG: GNAT family N-acetyltransferase [Chloroflexota bacterium]
MQNQTGDNATLLRPIKMQDVNFLQALYRELQPFDPVLSMAVFEQKLAQIINREGMNIFVLESAGQVVSSCYLNVIPNLTRSAAPYAVIENVVTLESARGRGFGKQVLQYAIDAAWEAGCYKVMLMTGSKNLATHAFYRACGFSADEKQAYIIRGPN